MNKITMNLRNMTRSKENQKIVYSQTNKNRVGLFADDLSAK
ncbi:hypothetical protein ACFL1L_05140 [Thermoplasmatota archaeon]